MSMPAFKWEISLGSLIPVLGLLATVVFAYASARTELSRLHADYAAAAAAFRTYQQAMDERVRSLETGAARSEERYVSLLQILGRIEARLERLDGGRP